MWLEYFLSTVSTLQRPRYSSPSPLRWTRTSVPWPTLSEGSIEYSPLPSLVQAKAASVPALRLVTSILSATMKAE